MNETVHATLESWANFYLITGSAAAALTGLQFVVQTLLASETIRPITGDPEGGISAFGTPTVVHFSLALVLSAILCAPWTEYGLLRLILAGLGTGALAYAVVVLRRARQQESYSPTAEDWIWHFVLPAAAYASVILSALIVHRGAESTLFLLAAATLLLLCVGIHNAWDTVTYLMITAFRAKQSQSESPPTPPDSSNENPTSNS
jgi:hypothetical protein